MVSPVTGPFVFRKEIKGAPLFNGFKPITGLIQRVWYRQRSPYNLHLPYSYSSEIVHPRGGRSGYSAVQYYEGLQFMPPDAGYSQRLYNEVYRSFMDDVLSNKATLGATIGEWKSSVSMISTRANQLLSGIRAAKRGDLSGVKRAWGKHAGIRSRLRSGGSHVLEYSFGWAPLVNDLNSALEVLHDRLPAFRIRKRKSFTYTGHKASTDSLNAYDTRWMTSVQTGWSIQGRIGMDNPNMALAQQLGLVNLAAVAWELVPNSYIVDYFFNVGDFLSSFTDMVGLKLEEGSTTKFEKVTASVSNYWSRYTNENRTWPDPFHYPLSWTFERVYVSRSAGIPGPTIDLRLPWRVSAKRALTSISRLLQQL